VTSDGRIGRWILIAPAAVLLALLGAAVASMLAASLTPKAGTLLSQYQRFLSDPTYLAYVTRSFRVALYATAGALIFGYPIAYVMSRVSAPIRRLLMLVLVLQFFSVNVTRIYALVLLLGNNGSINRMLLALGLVDSRVPLIYNELGVTIGLVSAALPFAVFPISTVLARIPLSLREAAQTLGASRTRTFWQVIFPLSLPGVSASVTIVFLYSLGAFATPLLLGGGFVDLIAIFSYEQAVNLSAYGFAAAGAVITLGCAFLAVYAFTRCMDRWMRAG
jgi:ABC-type spermidine/putrescine transport system permease subunit I